MSITKEPTRYEASALGQTAPPVAPPHAHPSVRLVACLRVTFGLVWAVDAVLKWLPGFRDGFGTMLEQAAKAQPGWLQPMFDLWTDLPHWGVTALAYVSAATESFFALALITGFARKSVYLLGGVYGLLIWAAGEGFGAPYRPGSTDVGAAIIYTFAFAALFLADRSGPNALSLDAYIEKRVHWWHRVAEVSRHRPQAHTVEPVPESSAA